MWLEVHDIATAEPGDVAVILPVLCVLYSQKRLLSLSEFLGMGQGDAKVPIEVVIIVEVLPDRFEVHQCVIELLEDEEALGHALSTGNGVTFRRRCSDHLEQVLCDSQMVRLLTILADDCMHDRLQDVFLRCQTLHVLDQIVRLFGLIILQVVNDEV